LPNLVDNYRETFVASILIVEDEIFVAGDIERVLEEAGHDVVGIAADRREALAAAPLAKIAFVDVNLRDGRTGPQVAYDLSREYGIRIVYVTANPGQIDPKADGAIGYIRKPFSEDAIVAVANFAAGRTSELISPEISLFSDVSGSTTI
jgi:CheY-like chemotaxis protein